VTRHRLRCSEALAEDACAHAWLQLCRTQPERTQNLPGWLRVVALHEGLRLLRLAGREPLAEEITGEEHGPEAGGRPVPLAERVEAPVEVELAVEAREALRALAGLRWRRRRVLALRGRGLQLQGDRRQVRGDLHERQPARDRGTGGAARAATRRLSPARPLPPVLGRSP
jgi:hypothetical protein